MNVIEATLPIRKTAIVVPLVVVAMNMGCGSTKNWWDTNRPNIALLDRNLTAQGAQVLIEEPGFEDVDLAEVIGPPPAVTSTADQHDESTLDQRLIEFRRRCGAKSEQCKFERNAIQERAIAASNQRCGKYQAFLKQLQTEGNYSGKTMSIVLSGLGAVFPAASTARALSGAAAIVQGSTETFNREFFNELAAQVITEGIDAKRAELYGAIRKRQGSVLAAYPLEAALADAIQYHAACSTMAGLRYAAEAVQKQKQKVTDDATLQYDDMVRSQAAVSGVKEKLEALRKDVDAIAKTISNESSEQASLRKNAQESVDDAIAKVGQLANDVAKLVTESAIFLGQIRTTESSGVARAQLGVNLAKARESAGAAEKALAESQKQVEAYRASR